MRSAFQIAKAIRKGKTKAKSFQAFTARINHASHITHSSSSHNTQLYLRNGTMALSDTNKRQRTEEGSESAGEPCSNGDHNLTKRSLALVPRPSYQSGDFVAVRHDDDSILNCIFKSWDGGKHHMDAIAGGDCSHASFETIEDAAAYAFGDGNNGMVMLSMILQMLPPRLLWLLKK